MNSKAVLLGIALGLSSGVANAALTSSEKGQIKDFVAAAKAADATKVRALVARTDLSPEESTEALASALTPVAFSPERAAFLKELTFGGMSVSARPILVPATVRALIARADALYERYVGGLDHQTDVISEIIAIYGWIEETIANAGSPTPSTHDPNVGVPVAVYEECSKVLREHLDRQSRWLKGDAVVSAKIAHLRAQFQTTLFDMLPDGMTRRVDAADRLGLKGARRGFLVDGGVIFADTGKMPDASVERVRQVFTHLPAAHGRVEVIDVRDDDSVGTLHARGPVVVVRPRPERYPFAAAAAPASFNPAASTVVHALAIVAAKHALEGRPEFAFQVRTDADAAIGDARRLLGRPWAPTSEHVLGAAIHAVLTDGAAATKLANARLGDARPETAALLSDALGALAFENDAKAGVLKVDVGAANGFAPATGVRLAPNGAATAFTLDGHAWSIERTAPSYVVLGMHRDGTPIVPSAPAKPQSPR
jgi:hypothetical protein